MASQKNTDTHAQPQAGPFQHLVELLLDSPNDRIEQVVPAFEQIAADRIPPKLLPVRYENRLAKLGWRTWADIGRYRINDLLSIPGIGTGSTHRLLRTILELADAQRESSHNQGNDLTASESLEAEPHTFLPTEVQRDLRTIWTWFCCTKTMNGLGDLFTGWGSIHAPTDVDNAIQRVSSYLPDTDTSPASFSKSAIEQLDALFLELPERDQMILLGRISLTNQKTLQEIGENHGVSRERIRQIESSVESYCREHLKDAQYQELRWLLDKVRREIGAGFPANLSEDVSRQLKTSIVRALSLSDEAVSFLLWLAGPYKLADGWYACASIPSVSSVKNFIDKFGVIDFEGTGNFLLDSGLAEQFLETWYTINLPYFKYGDSAVLYSGNLLDRAERVLAITGHPLSTQQILKATGDNAGERSTRLRLLEDSRFSRATRDTFSLSRWGLPEYSGIAAAIESELKSMGGEAEVEAVVHAVVSKFQSREASVRAYTATPKFILEKDRIRLRTDEPFQVSDSPQDLPGFSILNGELMWSVTVDADMLRGSGRPLPQDVAGWLHLDPGQSMLLESGTEETHLSWPLTSVQPTLGSIRSLLESNQYTEGMNVLLIFNRVLRTFRIGLPE